MENGPTPHLEGVRGDYAPTVLVPGDPKRARFIAENYLEEVKQVNSVRGAEGFTGSFNGVPISVQSVGMGIPSALIYYTELIRFYGVQRLIRVGSCGGLNESVRLGDLICASAAGTDSAAISQLNGGLSLPSIANWDLLISASQAALASDIPMTVGPVFTSDLFYGPDEKLFGNLRDLGILGVEMEIAGLYTIAAVEGIEALALVTVSDDIVRQEVMTSEERENTFDSMIKVALEVAGAN
ncbi:MAG: purine-nucleoside phosphorylase [Acidimicrobiales bacterium]|jgi:purine-nucleoside phosphorylase|nr:purine-nucleoside phosphorylase [Acidimicrobiales bacterium]HJM28610.1 purine-nucleoside phosphorylase [Acidimicrobiales bacterium]HJM97995.1 purine-nucleoside phosphorylase [Acidimicrobiales bacterium]